MNANLPVIAIVGRPNVGKSTLFNRLTRTRDALVADYPGLTRDRKYGRVRTESGDFLLVDTGGLPYLPASSTKGKSFPAEGIEEKVVRQVREALEEASQILFLVDAKQGLTAADEEIAKWLRRLEKPILLVINKIDGKDPHFAAAEFSSLGFSHMVSISAAHGRGVSRLLEQIQAKISPVWLPEEESIRVAVVGRPNVGKSTLINRLLGEERVIVADLPGTTRDVIAIPFKRDGRLYTLFDTAGIRRKSRVFEAVEKFSAIQAMQTIESVQVVIFLIDAREGVTDQDARLIGYVLEAGRSLVIGLNKWDGLSAEQKQAIKAQLSTKLAFAEFAEKIPISALHGTGVGELFDRIPILYEQAQTEFSTAWLNEVLKEAVERSAPPFGVRLKFAHQGGKHPPLIVIHGKKTRELPASYRRFLVHRFLQASKFKGTPIRLEFRESA